MSHDDDDNDDDDYDDDDDDDDDNDDDDGALSFFPLTFRQTPLEIRSKNLRQTARRQKADRQHDWTLQN